MDIAVSKPLAHINFNLLRQNGRGEEDVREMVLSVLLHELGYTDENIQRGKRLQHPYFKVGSKKRKAELIPDYLLKVQGSYAWVLEAKAPNESVTDADHVEQTYSYAIHPEIRCCYFAISNGMEFALYRDVRSEPILHFSLTEIEHYWESLQRFIAPDAFHDARRIDHPAEVFNEAWDYKTRPLPDEIPVKKRAAKRHFGVHGYFTKQSWNVVAEYIRNFTRPGDMVLDPFGGSGVTAVEALMNDRRAIHIDINPMSVMMTEALTIPVAQQDLADAVQRVLAKYAQRNPKTEDEINYVLREYNWPRYHKLPPGSDVEYVHQLFSDQQLASLAVLLKCIREERDNKPIEKSLMLAFSSTLNKINLTYHHSRAASENAGDSGPMRYYRYRLAPEAVTLDIATTFARKATALMQAKLEMQPKINASTIHHLQVMRGTATRLRAIPSESVDYIYTDPPYGKKIPYLDLSEMWNAWLSLVVSDEDRRNEAIEGGSRRKTKEEYNDLIADSIAEMYRVLKMDRWLSFVFAHKDPEFWHLIIKAAEFQGFEYVGAVKQGNGQTSFKKRQHPFTVLSGQLIMNFRKSYRPKSMLSAHLGMDIADVVTDIIQGTIIRRPDGATLEQINDELIIKGLELGFLDLLRREYKDLTALLRESYDFDRSTQRFRIRPDSSLSTRIGQDERIHYYLISYLRRAARQHKDPDLDEIVPAIMQALGTDKSSNEKILKALNAVAVRVNEGGGWRLKDTGQGSLFVY